MGRGPASRFGLIPTSLSPPRHAPPRRLSPSSFSREFLRLNPRLVVVVHSRGVMWRSKLVDHGVRIHSDTKSNLARLQYPHPLEPLLLPNPNQLSLHPRPLPHVPSTLPRSFHAPSFLRRQQVVSGHLDNSTPICGTRPSPEMDADGNSPWKIILPPSSCVCSRRADGSEGRRSRNETLIHSGRIERRGIFGRFGRCRFSLRWIMSRLLLLYRII